MFKCFSVHHFIMSLRVLKYIAELEEQGRATIGKIVDGRLKWDKNYGTPEYDTEHHQHVNHLLDELEEQNLITYPTKGSGFIELTERGKKVSVILLEKKS